MELLKSIDILVPAIEEANKKLLRERAKLMDISRQAEEKGIPVNDDQEEAGSTDSDQP